MNKNPGILHIYSPTPKRKGVHIVGDREGLYRLWLGIGKAMISRAGQEKAKVMASTSNWYPIHILRVDPETQFFKHFPPK